MIKYFLRIEGVNLANFVYDTNDLSTIRGGGLILLDAPEKLIEELQKHFPSPRSITQGASWGLLSFFAEDADQAHQVADHARQFLATKAPYRFATFVVDVLPAGDDSLYPQRREQLAALNRWRQMQSPSLVIPQTVEANEIPEIEEQAVVVCEFDHISPACGMVRKGRKADGESNLLAVGQSVSARRKHGIEKKDWYQKKTNRKKFPDLVNDFNELADLGNQAHPLNNKMAVLYLDGNNFGALQRKHCRTPAQQHHFDQKIRREFQQGTLQRLLKEILADSSWLNKDKLRFETLLWGGDEIIWVVPAGKGWWLLARFFHEVAARWRFPSPEDPLTLAAGLVFCHCKAPIQRIVHLARQLGDLAKADRTANKVAYQVLESFDHAGPDLAAFRVRRCPSGVLPHQLLLDGNAMWPLFESRAIPTLQHKLPKRQLHRFIEQLYLDTATREHHMQNMLRDIAPDHWQLVKNCLGGSDIAPWLHLYELWDYLSEEPTAQSVPPEEEADHAAR